MEFGNIGIGNLQLLSLSLAIFVNSFIATQYSPLVMGAAILSHYLYCLYYSWPGLLKLGKTNKGLLKLGTMVILIVGSAYLKEPFLILYFGLHHCMSETFILESQLKDRVGHFVKPVFLMRFILHTVLYIHLSKFTGITRFLNPTASLNILAVTAILYLLIVTFSSLPDKNKDSLFASDGLFLFVALLIQLNVFRFDFLTLDLYHSLFWIVVPTVGLYFKGGYQKSKAFLLPNLLVVVASAGVMLLIAHYMHASSRDELNLMSQKILKYGGYVHVSMSFFLMKFSHSQALMDSQNQDALIVPSNNSLAEV
jgi:hypothetical protein